MSTIWYWVSPIWSDLLRFGQIWSDLVIRVTENIIVLIQYYTASWVGYGSAVRVSASYSIAPTYLHVPSPPGLLGV